MWFVTAHWVITFDLCLVLCLFVILQIFWLCWSWCSLSRKSFDFVNLWLKLSFSLFSCVNLNFLGDCYLVRLYFYKCLLYFCKLTAVCFVCVSARFFIYVNKIYYYYYDSDDEVADSGWCVFSTDLVLAYLGCPGELGVKPHCCLLLWFFYFCQF